MWRKKKKGSFDTLSAAALGLLVFIIVAAVGALVLSQFKTQSCKTNGDTYVNGECYSTYDASNASNNVIDHPTSYNMTTTGLNATHDLVGWAPIIVVVIAGIIILGYFGLQRFG